MDWYCRPGSEAELPRDVRAELCSKGPVLITATLRNGIDGRIGLVEEMLRARPPGEETVVIPCENDISSTWDRIETLCQEIGAIYLRPLVNRIAVADGQPDARPDGALSSALEVRTTNTHELGEWIVASPERPSEILTALQINDEFDVVKDLEDLEMRLRRKLYLVNRELSLSPDSDRVAVEAYETCLRGWEQATAIDRRVRRIERALAGHRKRLGQAPRASRTPPTRDPRSGSPTTPARAPESRA